MKIKIPLILALLATWGTIAQDLPTYAPVSPTAASLGKFGSFPVNTNLGTTDITIPLYVIRQGDIEIPITLSYNATSGIRVNEEASWVGLGWTLNAGGAIVRSVQGQPSTADIPDLGNMDFTLANYNYMYDVARGWADTAQDLYFFNYSGNSGKFCYDQNKSEFTFFDYKPIEISGTVETGGYLFNAKLSNGQKLEFSAHETIDKWQNSQLPIYYRQYRTTSYLTKVTSVNQVDYVTLTYDDHTLENNKQISTDAVTVATGVPITIAPSPVPIISDATTIYSKILNRIDFKNGYVTFEYGLDRLDSDSPRLDHIKVYSSIDNTDTLIKQISFDYGYYSRTGGNTYSTSIAGYNPDYYTKSLRLDEIDIHSNTSEPQSYAFEYNTTTLPIRNSSAQDFWGYANNNNGSYMHNREARMYFSIPNGDFVFDDTVGSFDLDVGTGNREGDEQKSKAGILTKVTYPTGGHTMFEYESNKYETTLTTPVYTTHSESIYVEGTGGGATCGTSVETTTISPQNTPMNAKLNIIFSEALGGNANQSYVVFNGVTYKRSGLLPGATTYPYTTYSIDISLSSGQQYTLEAQEYGVGAPGASGCPSISASVTWQESDGVTTEMVEKIAGGLRIKSITNYVAPNTPYVTKKTFEYDAPNILTPINLLDYQTLKMAVGTAQWGQDVTAGGYSNTISSSPSYSLNVNGGPSIEYTMITEYDHDASGNDNGKTIHEYEPTFSRTMFQTTGPGTDHLFDIFVHPNFHGSNCNGLIVPSSIPYFEHIRVNGYGNFSNYFVKSWGSGSIKKRSYHKRNIDNSYTKIREEEHFYAPVDEASLFINYVNDMIPWTQSQVTPNDFNGDPCYWANYTFMSNQGFYSFGRKLMTGSTEVLFDENGANPVTTQKTYSYNNPSYFRTGETLTDSGGKIFRTETAYPEDIANPSAVVQKLIALNRVSEPITSNTYVKVGLDPEQQLSAQLTSYREWETDKVFPEMVKIAKGENGVLEDRVVYYDYDTLGNPLELSKANGAHISYIWGYNGQYPIAKLENVTSAQRSAIQALVDTAVTASDADDDRTVDTTDGTPVGNEGALRAALKNIRGHSSLSNAMITTYTYDPLIGVTSITDPKGYIMYYEYDAFNRLEFVKDADGNLVSENKYRYKNQQ